MNDDLISAIQTFTLYARNVLEGEAELQLEGLYGWLPDGSFRPGSSCPALALKRAGETRPRLELFAEEEHVAGFDAKSARRRLVRETAFTWLNRIVALRLLEERRLIKLTISRLKQSNGFIYWLTDESNAEAYALYQQGDLPLNLMGEGPADVAYRNFLLWQCGELAREISILFESGTPASYLCPRPPVLRQLIEALNAENVAAAWQAGNEETVGWIYQSFNAEEEASIRASFLSNHRVTAEEIGPVTQLFTPRWVVKYLVHNSLGHLWVEMHPDSRLKTTLEYLVPAELSQNRPLKLVRQISFMDPACGSMHFGLVAFDLFIEMYKEELENVGKEGWPPKPSVATPEEIPGAIILHNLHGIDLDLRAVQISALALFLRARSVNNACSFTDRNLACANIEAITGGQLEKFINQTKFGHPIYERILRQLAERLKDSSHLGSLLRLEKDIELLVAEEKRKAEFTKQLSIAFPGTVPEQFETRQGIEEFFEIIVVQLQQYLDFFVRSSHQEGKSTDHFSAEAAKGLRFLNLVERRYDVVTTNPPYLDSRDYSTVHKKFLESSYPDAKRNLYAAFIQRCSELACENGLVGMLTGQSFMFIRTFEALRLKLLDKNAVDTLAQFDYHLFKGRVDTTAFILRGEPDESARQNHQGVYFRLVRERDAEGKRQAFESALAALRAGKSHQLVFTYRQGDFDAIPRKPWVYWMPANIRELFRQGRLLAGIAPPRVGLQTGNNSRFLRKWWEIGLRRINRNAISCEDSARSGFKWFPYMKGGAPKPWFGNQEHVVNWDADGGEIRAFCPRAVVRNPGFYFRKGVTWSDVSSKGFAGRLSPGGFIHDVKGMTCYPIGASFSTVLGLFNSTIARFILSALNPTISYQVGDIERLPIPLQSSEILETLVQEAVALAIHDSTESELTYDFISPPLFVASVDERHARLHEVEEEIDKEVTLLYDLNETQRVAIKRELEGITASAMDEENDSDKDDETEDEVTVGVWNDASLGRAWISYAFGVALGHYDIGKPEGLG